MTNKLKQILFLHIVLAFTLFIVSQSFHFVPFVDLECKNLLIDTTLFFILFILPITFLISMLRIANYES